MLIVTRYILKEHLSPFFSGLATITFVFVLNLLFRELGRLLGKGLAISVILEFFILNLAWILALAVPMAVLIATLMAFGRLSGDNEIVALKASGVNLYRLIIPVAIAAVFVAIGLERFNNCVLPDANHRVRLLSRDIRKKRPTIAIEPHVFFDEIPDYSLMVYDIKKIGGEDILKGVIIHDRSEKGKRRTILAEKGKMEYLSSPEGLKFILFNGEVHEVDDKDFENYQRSIFERQVIFIPVSNIELKRTSRGRRGEREKSASMMRDDIKRNLKAIKNSEEQIRQAVRNDLATIFPDEYIDLIKRGREDVNLFYAKLYSKRKQDPSIRISRMIDQIQGLKRIINGYRRSNNALWVEIHKKYSIPFACIVFVFIGAPLGIMARQGGLAIGGGMSLVFFLIYWTFLIGGEQLADRMIIRPATAMWSPNVLVGTLGIYLVIKTVRETTFIKLDRLRQILSSLYRRKSKC